MPWLMAAAAVVTAVSSAYGANQSKRAAKENKKLAEAETAESIQRTQEAQGITEGRIRTEIGASGFAAGSSLDRYLASTEAGHRSDIDWMRTSAASQQAIADREAAAITRANFISGMGQVASYASQARTTGTKYGWGSVRKPKSGAGEVR